jgi:hypothetical protein
MTSPPNAFVTGEDLLVLQPGQAVTHTWGIQALDDRIPNFPERLWSPPSAPVMADNQLTGP